MEISENTVLEIRSIINNDEISTKVIDIITGIKAKVKPCSYCNGTGFVSEK